MCASTENGLRVPEASRRRFLRHSRPPRRPILHLRPSGSRSLQPVGRGPSSTRVGKAFRPRVVGDAQPRQTAAGGAAIAGSAVGKAGSRRIPTVSPGRQVAVVLRHRDLTPCSSRTGAGPVRCPPRAVRVARGEQTGVSMAVVEVQQRAAPRRSTASPNLVAFAHPRTGTIADPVPAFPRKLRGVRGAFPFSPNWRIHPLEEVRDEISLS